MGFLKPNTVTPPPPPAPPPAAQPPTIASGGVAGASAAAMARARGAEGAGFNGTDLSDGLARSTPPTATQSLAGSK